MAENKVEIDGTKITDETSFHALFQVQMGFPDFYGKNMNAWIDCMGDIHLNTGMTKFLLPPDQPLIIMVNDTETFSKTCPDVLSAFIECTAFVNKQHIKSSAPIQIVFN